MHDELVEMPVRLDSARDTIPGHFDLCVPSLDDHPSPSPSPPSRWPPPLPVGTHAALADVTFPCWEAARERRYSMPHSCSGLRVAQYAAKGAHQPQSDSRARHSQLGLELSRKVPSPRPQLREARDDSAKGPRRGPPSPVESLFTVAHQALAEMRNTTPRPTSDI